MLLKNVKMRTFWRKKTPDIFYVRLKAKEKNSLQEALILYPG